MAMHARRRRRRCTIYWMPKSLANVSCPTSVSRAAKRRRGLEASCPRVPRIGRKEAAPNQTTYSYSLSSIALRILCWCVCRKLLMWYTAVTSKELNHKSKQARNPTEKPDHQSQTNLHTTAAFLSVGERGSFVAPCGTGERTKTPSMRARSATPAAHDKRRSRFTTNNKGRTCF